MASVYENYRHKLDISTIQPLDQRKQISKFERLSGGIAILITKACKICEWSKPVMAASNLELPISNCIMDQLFTNARVRDRNYYIIDDYSGMCDID